MATSSTTTADESLLERLFSPLPRWGWEFVQPPSPRPSPEAARPPRWQEPPAADTRSIEAARWKARRKLRGRILIAGFLLLVGLAEVAHGGIVLVLPALALSYFWFGPIVLAGRRVAAAQRKVDEERAARRAAYEAQVADWRRRVDGHAVAERRRIDAELLWYPLRLESGPSRVDVFGGTPAGWASLTATIGSTLLAAGASMVILDFSEADIGGGLAALAAHRSFPVRRCETPQQLAGLHLLDGLTPEDVAEVIAAAANTGRQTADRVETRALDADLLAAVTGRLDAPFTFGRLSAGLRVLRRVYDGGEDGPLLPDEEARLTTQVDAIGHTERVENELRYLNNVADLLARDEPTTAPDGGRPAPLTIVAPATHSERRKEFTENLVLHGLLHQLRAGVDRLSADVVIVAGAARFGTETLEALARHARRRGVEVVLMLEHLRGDLEQFLGGSGSAALLMQMPNPKEAELAAQFIGRGHKFVLSQVTRSIGETHTQTGGTSTGSSEGTSWTEGRNSGVSYGPGLSFGPFGRSTNRGRSSSFGESHTYSRQTSDGWSEAQATTSGTTEARVYEYTVEPAALQSLPPTAFVLVEPGGDGRRVRFGDCNPGIVALDRVSDEPRSSEDTAAIAS